MEYFIVGLGVLWVGWSATGVVLNGITFRRRLRLDEAWLAVATGDHETARAIFEELSKHRRAYFADAGRHGLAFLDLIGGHYAAASEQFGALRKAGSYRRDWQQSFFSEAMAICAALAGDLDVAEARLEEATHSTHLSPKAHTLVACRRGDYETALAIDPGQLGDNHDSRVYRLMIAFALHAQGDEEHAREWIQSVSIYYAGEYDYLARDWPELRAFLASHPPLPKAADLPVARVVSARRAPPER